MAVQLAPVGRPVAALEGPLDALSVDAMSVVPGAHGNTIHDRQPISLKVPAAQARLLDIDTAQVTVTDLGTGETQVPTVSTSVGPDGVLSVTTEAVHLVADHDYAARASVGSRAYEWRFRRMPFTVASVTATVPPARGVSTAPGEWAFVPEVKVAPFDVTAGRTAHSGYGPVGQRVPLGGATVAYTAGDGTRARLSGVYLPDATATVYRPFQKAQAEAPWTTQASYNDVRLAPVVVNLPPDATDAVLELGTVQTTGYTPAQDCVLPSAAMPACMPDPLRFYMPEDFAAHLLDVQQEFGSRAALGESPVFLTQLMPDPENPLRGVWGAVTLDHGIVYTTFEEELLALLDGVAYRSNVGPQVPSQFDDACAAGYSCTSQAAAQESTASLRQRCVRPDGQDRLTDSYAGETKNCRQFNSVNEIRAGEPTLYGTWQYRFSAGVVSQIGYNDNRSTSTPNEELGIAWDDKTGWAINHGIQIGRYDVYYCDGSEYQATSGQDWVHKWSSQQAQDQYMPRTGIGPYGKAFVHGRQWMKSVDLGMPSQYTNCYGFFENPNLRTAGTAVGRATIFYVEAIADTLNRGMSGTAVATFGHFWTYYGYDFDIHTSFGAGRRGPTWGASFEIRPYQEQRSTQFQFDKGYTIQ